MNKKENLHYQQTDKAIQNYVLDLLGKKNIDKITVTEICTHLGINRSTFYAHYPNVYDVVEKIEYGMSYEMEIRFKEKLKISRNEAFLEIFRFVYEHKDFYRICIHHGSTIHFCNDVSFENLSAYSDSIMQKIGFLSETQYHYHIAFFRAGLNALIREWLLRDCKETPEELYDILLQEYKMYSITTTAVSIPFHNI